MPLGSGMGTFVPVYASVEKSEDLLANVFANRAHNDVLELWLETGVVGLALMAVFAMWFILRSLDVWGRTPVGLRPIDQSLARAATIVVALLIAHSFVDYPLRTGAMMAMMAFACALMIKPPVGAERTAKPEQKGAQEDVAAAEQAGRAREAFAMHELPSQWSPSASRPQGGMAKTEEEAAPPEPQPKGERWGKDVEWPEQWRKPKKPGDPDGDDKKT